MTPDQISVALTTHNGQEYIREQLDSILSQTIKANEIIVCDDSSTDGTVPILKEYESKGLLKLFINETPLGIVQNFQKAISLCSGQYIALCDQDDVWNPAKLQVSLEKMKEIEDPNLPCLTYSDLEVVDENLRVIEKSFWQYLRVHPISENFYSLLYGNVVTGCTLLLNSHFKKYVKSIPFNALMHDQWLGLVAYGLGKVGVITEKTVKYKRHQDNATIVKKISGGDRIARALSLAIKEFRTGSTLSAELSQAELFYDMYGTSLPEHKLKDLKNFLRLERQGFFIRKIKKILTKRFTRFFTTHRKN